MHCVIICVLKQKHDQRIVALPKWLNCIIYVDKNINQIHNPAEIMYDMTNERGKKTLKTPW